ncbi:MAG: hypothetical protein RJB38_1631 [Pseudomonadota bacterium]|jgi:phenylalanine-4-hydroxylase
MAATTLPLTERIPEHLAPFVVQQDPSLYTAIDHASWRFILRISRAFFAKNAHRKYLDGLDETGISTERIPLISEMDEKLRKFGWRAVAVSGFIPPAAFMEFQSLGVLPIACDMRQLENLAYTPAPDIVHEAAGHAPIIADPEYAAYLRKYGEVSRKAISSAEDLAVYQAVRKLSEIKEDPHSSAEQIDKANRELELAVISQTAPSEAALLARMNWWTVEYGLVGPLESPKIYGAGLLSSVGESYHCLSSKVKKIPLSIDCVKVPYDITRPQPQLFVTPNFRTLSKVLEEFSETMAYRVGGLAALRIAIAARTITTTQFDSEVQIGGRLVEAITDSLENPAYLRFEGPCQLAYGDHEISDQGPRQHPEGFGTPVGQVVWNGSLRRPQSLKDPEIQGVTELLFDSNVRVRGKLVSSIRRAGNLAVLTFENCWVTLGDRILFRPEWGLYDLACGSAVSSVYGGAPDRAKYSIATETTPLQRGFQKTNLTDETIVLNELYSEVRRVRERGQREDTVERLNRVHEALERDHPSDWLLRMELLELDQLWRLFSPWRSAVLTRVAEIARSKPELAQVIRRGMELIA